MHNASVLYVDQHFHSSSWECKMTSHTSGRSVILSAIKLKKFRSIDEYTAAKSSLQYFPYISWAPKCEKWTFKNFRRLACKLQSNLWSLVICFYLLHIYSSLYNVNSRFGQKTRIPVIGSSSNSLYVKFVSDYSINFKGFAAVYAKDEGDYVWM